MRKRLVEEIQEVVSTFSRQQGYAAVVDSSGDSLNGVPIFVYTDARDDVTQQIVELLNKGKASDPEAAKLP